MPCIASHRIASIHVPLPARWRGSSLKYLVALAPAKAAGSATMSSQPLGNHAISLIDATQQPSSRQQTRDLNSLLHAITSCQGGGPSHPTTLVVGNLVNPH